MTGSELWQWDAVDLAQAIRLRKVSSREATQAVLQRMEQVNPRLNAVVLPLADQALKAADAADAAVKRGEVVGPLHGVPVTIKENIDQAGLPTVNGVEAFKDLVAKEDSPTVANWKKAGAVIFGRTNTPAFSIRWDTDNAVRGRTNNPWSKARTPGGSSGGAGAAVATGVGPLAHGNDYGGSVRYPAYCCGIAGIRPTMGRAPGFNATAPGERPPTAQLMAVQGPLARRVRDLRIGLAAMSDRDARDAWWVPAPLQGPPPSRPIHVAMVTSSPGFFVRPDVAQAVRSAGKALADAGYVVEEVQPPSIEEATALWAKLVFADTRHLMLETIEKLGDAGVKTAIGLWFEIVQDVTVREYILASAEVLKHRRAWNLFLEKYPLVVGPTSGDLPFQIGFDTKDVESTRHVLKAQALMTAINLLGLPSVAVPVGSIAAADAPRGVPVGVQIIAGRYREDLALDAAEVVEAQHGLPTPIDPVW